MTDRPLRTNLHPDTLHQRNVAGHVLYSPVVVVNGGRLVLVSGLLARDRDGHIIGKGDMAAQIRQVGENMKVALEAAGASLSDLVRTQTFVTDIEEFFRHMDERMKYFFASPTSSTIQISRLSHPDFMIEVEAMAVIPD